MIAVLYADPKGIYSKMKNIDLWDKSRDARLYSGPYPVIAHPPCQLWGRFAHVNYARWGGEHNRPGNDHGCFSAALASVKQWGGVLEHPAFSDAWKAFDLSRPIPNTWTKDNDGWVCEIWQPAYGHKARKRTWLFYSGSIRPKDLRWERLEASHQIGFHDQRGKDRNKPTISKRAASATPVDFRDELIALVNPLTAANPAPPATEDE